MFHRNITIPSKISSGKFSFAGICRTLVDDFKIYRLHFLRDASTYDKSTTSQIKNFLIPLDDKRNITDNEKAKNNITNIIHNFFSELNKYLNFPLQEKLYNDAVVAILIVLCREYHLYHKRIIVKDDNFFIKLSEIINKYNSDEIKDFRSQSNTQQKKNKLDEIIMNLKIIYKDDFGPHNQPKILHKISTFIDKKFPDFLNTTIFERYGVNMIDEIFSNKKEKILNKIKTTDRKAHHALEFRSQLIDKVLYTGRVKKGSIILWDDYYKNIFVGLKGKNKFKDKQRLTEAFERIADYRANIVHDDFIDKHDKNRKKITEGLLGQLNSIIDDYLE